MNKKLLLVGFVLFVINLLFGATSLSFTQSQNDKVVGPQNNEMPTSAITVEAWYYAIPNDDGPYKTVISTGYAYNSANGWLLRLPRSSQSEIPHVRIKTTDGTGYINASSGTANEWHHLAFTYDGATLNLFLDGVLQDSANLTGNIVYDTDDHLNIGQMANSINEPWNGYIDEVRIWDIALSEDTINNWKDKEVNNSHPNFNNLFIYYKFNEGSGQIVGDDSGNGLDAVLGDDSSVETDDPIWYNDSPLPVILSDFNAVYTYSKIFISWITASEDNNAYWNIYKNVTQNFEQAYKINVTPIPGANTSSTETNYSFIDNATFLDDSVYFYWLESLDFSGGSHIYGPIEIRVADNSNDNDSPELTKKYGLISNYPNPFNPITNIKFRLKKSGKVKLEIFNSKGVKITTVYNGYVQSEKEYQINWNAKNLESGLYFYKLSTNNNKTYVKKMILLK